jgi:monofunctional biosynthetic peptidoglycan transglycosylase
MKGMIMMAVILDMSVVPWQPINDGVMGGLSSGRMEQSGDVLRFEGTLSLENNGGFASVRRSIGEDLAKATSVQLRVRGDGRTYQFRLRQDDRFDGVAWRSEFSTDGEWQTVDLPFDQFRPVFRGRQVPEAGPVTPAAIRQIGFMLADKVPGPFTLEIRSIVFTPHQPKSK